MTQPELPTFLGVRVLPLRDPLGRRLAQLLPGLLVFGIALSLAIRGEFGTNPWTVFHEGASEQLGISIGMMVILTGAVLLLLFIPLREGMGLGTALNVGVIGFVIDATLAIVPPLDSTLARLASIGIAPVLIGLASGLYIGAGLGPGPRDGLMTALERRGLSISVARSCIEVAALVTGWFLGGTVGFGTIYMALTVGHWVKFFLTRLRIDPVT